MKEPRWVSLAVVLAIHEAQLSEHGGAASVRDQALLESALARPRQIFSSAERVTLPGLASAYAFGLARQHAFIDGKKRTAWVVCATFLELNGKQVLADQAEVVAMMLALAEGSLEEDQCTEWLNRACA